MVVAVGMGVSDKKGLDLIKNLSKLTGSVLGSSRLVAQVRHFVGADYYIGVSGKKFIGELHI